MAEDWRSDELRAERAALGNQIAAHEAYITRLEQLRATADAAWGEHTARLHTLTNEQCALRQTVSERGMITGPDGRPFSGPMMREQDRYDELEAERGAEEQRYRRWRDERQIEVSNGPISRDWSTRDPLAVAGKIAEQRRMLAMLGQRLPQIEDELAALQAVEAAPAVQERPAPGLVERLRQKIG